MSSLATLVLVASSVVGQAQPEQALKEWGDLVVGGVWVNTNADGEKTQHTYRWGINNRFLLFTSRGAQFPGQSMIGVDPKSKQVTFWDFSEDGSVGNGTLVRVADGVWTMKGESHGGAEDSTWSLRATKVDADTIKVDMYVQNGEPSEDRVWTRHQRQETTFAEFKEFGNLMVGRWVGDITFIADWPGQTKRQGDKVTGYTTYSWIVDGKAIESVEHAGNTVGKTLISWDGTTNQIRLSHVGSAGGTYQAVAWKSKPNKWNWRVTGGGQADGKRMGGQGSWTFKDDGNTLVLNGSVLLDGKKLPKLHDVYTRLSERE